MSACAATATTTATATATSTSLACGRWRRYNVVEMFCQVRNAAAAARTMWHLPSAGGRQKEREGGREHCLLQANLLPYLLFNHNGKFEARRNKLLKFAKIITPCNAFCNRKSRKSNARQTTLHYKHYNRSWPMPPTSGRRCCCCCRCCCTVAAAAETAAGCNSNRTS